MTVNELLETLEGLGADTDAVFTGAGNPEDRYAVVREQGAWHVYYTERGNKVLDHQFEHESEACEYLLALLRDDQTIWRS